MLLMFSSGNTNRLSITATGESVVGNNYIGLINGYCQEKKIQCDYILDHRDGPSHNPQSVSTYVCTLDTMPAGTIERSL